MARTVALLSELVKGAEKHPKEFWLPREATKVLFFLSRMVIDDFKKLKIMQLPVVNHRPSPAS